jgi:alkylation response protein AidB-like acyl-CoA dehydrogenase
MRGTGSHDFAVRDVFVPDHRVWHASAFEIKNPAYGSPGYRLGIWLVAAWNASVLLGIAQAAVDGLLDLADRKTPSYTQIGLGDKPIVQDRIARARALIEAGESYVWSSVGNALEFAQDAPKCDIEHGIPIALAGSFAVEAATEAVDLVHACAGTSAIRDEGPFQQYFRDVHTLTQHAFSSPSRFESVGKLMLGKETDWVFYYL